MTAVAMGLEDWTPTAPMNAAHDIRAALHGRDLLSIRDLSRNELIGLLALAAEVRREPARYAGALTGRTLVDGGSSDMRRTVADALGGFLTQMTRDTRVPPPPDSSILSAT